MNQMIKNIPQSQNTKQLCTKSKTFHTQEIPITSLSSLMQLRKVSYKKVKLNDQLSYQILSPYDQSTYQSTIDHFSSEQVSNSLSSFKEEHRDKGSMKEKVCRIRNNSFFTPGLYQQLTEFLSSNKVIIEDKDLTCIKFMESYQPEEWMDLDKNIQRQVRVRMKQVSQERQLKFIKELKNLFYLYLNGDYRGIGEASIMKVGNHNGSYDRMTQNRFVSYKYKSKHINFDQVMEKQTQLEESSTDKVNLSTDDLQQKQVIYNKSKYVMQFLLKLLDKDHLAFLDIPIGFDETIYQIQNRIKESSKRNKLSQSQFYNHNHFDCLFLQLTSENNNYLESSHELSSLHKQVFCVEDLENLFSRNSINLNKLMISQIVLSQIELIRTRVIPNLPINTLSFKSASKLKYFERICDSIIKLNQGIIISKF